MRLLLGALLWVLTPSVSHAELLLRVSGPEDAVQTIRDGQVLAFGLTLPKSVNNLSVAIGPNATCVRCTIKAWISTGIDADFNPADLRAVSESASYNARLFEGVSLGAGTYFVVVRVLSGSLVWPASLGETATAAPNVTRQGDWRADQGNEIGPASDFSLLVGAAGSLHYYLTNEVCGDGSVDLKDGCDDGNTRAEDGCSASCTVERGYTCAYNGLGTRSTCTTACGDGIKVPAEACDDGNANAGDGCRADCTVERCGDGARDPQEQCDDGNSRDGDGCDASCRVAVCGDRIASPPEECDDGNQTSGDGCNGACKREACGNGVLDVGEQCDDANSQSGDGCRNNCRLEQCGDGYVDLGEQCDDANVRNGDGCRDNCTVERCGDGVKDPQEQCDDGNQASGDGCRAACTVESCGDGVRDPQEQCDDGNVVPADSCNEDCSAPRCGDGRLDSGEQCDDGNSVPGDGCSATCKREVCGNGIKDAGEQCDDGNTRDKDGCSVRCTLEAAAGEGCAASYWQRDRHGRAWKRFTPNASYATVFGVKTSLKLTLLNALKQCNQGEAGLARQAVAALLNAANTSIKFAWSVEQVTAKVRSAYTTRGYEALRRELQTENERRPCPLRDDGGCYRDAR
ncbi:MAG: DUF4215 domain-containing protein [Polyangiales bacterium]